MKKQIIAALFSAASLVQAGPLLEATANAEHSASSGFMQRLGQQAQSLSDRTSDVVFSAMAKLDVPYRLGGESRDTGYDCSGLVHAVYKQTLGLMLPRRAAEQASSTQKITKADLRPGDLVFFNTMRRSYSHVGIYIGDNKFIHAPRTGARVRVENMNIKYWSTRFDGARRVTPVGGNDTVRLASITPSDDTGSTASTTVPLMLSAVNNSHREAARMALQLAAQTSDSSHNEASAVESTIHLPTSTSAPSYALLAPQVDTPQVLAPATPESSLGKLAPSQPKKAEKTEKDERQTKGSEGKKTRASANSKASKASVKTAKASKNNKSSKTASAQKTRQATKSAKTAKGVKASKSTAKKSTGVKTAKTRTGRTA